MSEAKAMAEKKVEKKAKKGPALPGSFQPIKEIASFYTGKGHNGIAIILFDGHWFKTVYAEGNKFRRVITCFAEPLQDSASIELKEALRQLRRNNKWNPMKAILANPSHLTTARVVRLPSVIKNEIREMVNLQIEKLAPHGKEETVNYYEVLSQERDGYSRVLIVLTHQDVVEKAAALIQDLRGSLERAGSEIDGFVNWFQIVFRGKSKDAAILFADVDSETTSILVFHKGKPCFHRSIAIGYQNLAQTTSDEEPAKFVAEFQRSLETFESEGQNVRCAEVVLTGLAEHLPGVQDLVQKSLNLPTQIHSSFKGLNISREAAAENTRKHKVSFTGLLGLALLPSPGDLSTSRLKLRRAFEIRTRSLIILGSQVLIGVVMLSFLLIATAHKDLSKNEWLVTQSKSISKDAEMLDLYLGQLAVAEKKIKSQGQLLEILTELNKLTPPAIRWNSFTYASDTEVVISGVSREISKVFEMVKEIEKSPLFGKAEARRVAQRKIKDEDVTEFEIVCPIEDMT